MTRVWLSEWEWACCGDPFVVGDDVDFGISARGGVDGWLIENLGAELAATVDALESHHEHEFPDRVRGRVSAIHAVVQQFIERRELRRPRHGAPPDSVMPADGAEWPDVRRLALGNGVWVASRPDRYVTVSEPVPGSATLEASAGVRLLDSEPDDAASDDLDLVAPRAEPPVERRVRQSTGWLVDVDEG